MQLRFLSTSCWPFIKCLILREQTNENGFLSKPILDLAPEKAVKKPNIGTVVSTGDGTKHNEMVVKPGDQILFNRYAGLELMFKGEKHYVIMANEIIGVLDDINDISLEEFE